MPQCIYELAYRDDADSVRALLKSRAYLANALYQEKTLDKFHRTWSNGIWYTKLIVGGVGASAVNVAAYIEAIPSGGASLAAVPVATAVGTTIVMIGEKQFMPYRFNKESWTPLHFAALSNAAAAAIVLLEAGADMSAKSTTGETCFDVAQYMGYGDFIKTCKAFTSHLTGCAEKERVLLKKLEVAYTVSNQLSQTSNYHQWTLLHMALVCVIGCGVKHCLPWIPAKLLIGLIAVYLLHQYGSRIMSSESRNSSSSALVFRL